LSRDRFESIEIGTPQEQSVTDSKKNQQQTAPRDNSPDVLLRVYDRLYAKHGPQHWWPGDGPLEIILGALLTQFTAWTNVEKALSNLKDARVMSIEALRDIPDERLAALLRPSGTFNTKTRKVKALINHLVEDHGGGMGSLLSQEPATLRLELLSIYGIGEETADDILLYAAGAPYFVIDAYTCRIVNRLGLAPEQQGYQAYQQLFHRRLPRDTALYNEYHALLNRHAKETCKVRPLCAGCCLLDLCPIGQAAISSV